MTATESAARPRVSWFELFYDLVLVASVLHGSEVFTDEPTWITGLWLAGTLMVVLTIWFLTTLSFNARREDWALRRFLALVQMVAVVIASLSISREQGVGDDVGLGALAVAFATIAVLYARHSRRGTMAAQESRLIAVTTAAAAAVFLLGAVAARLTTVDDGGLSLLALVVGMALAIVPMLTVGLTRLAAGGQIYRDHLSERLGQIVIIALGESFVDLILSLSPLPSIPNPVFLIGTFLVMYALWSIYFRSVLPEGMPRGAARIRWWIACHYLLLFGLIGAAEGLALLSSTPLLEPSAVASYRVSLPLFYALVGMGILTLLAGGTERRLAVIHAFAAGLLLVITIAGGVVFPDQPMAVGALAAVVVLVDAAACARLAHVRPDNHGSPT